MTEKLGIAMTDEFMQLGTNDAISNSHEEIVVDIVKYEDEISWAFGSD